MRKTLAKISSSLIFLCLFLLTSSSVIFAACAEIRSHSGTRFCDYNNNNTADVGETPFADCDGSRCCATTAQCSSATGTSSSGCDPGSGFIPLGDCLKLSDDKQINETYTTPAFLANLLVRNLFVAGGVIFFFMFLIAGFQFITGGKKGLDNAKQIATASLIGFLLMFAAYWIVQIVAVLTKTDIPI